MLISLQAKDINMPLSLSTRGIALTACFAALYVIVSSWNLFPIIGAEGRWIGASVVMAPLFGIVLGPAFGVLAITVGGTAGAFFFPTGPFGPLSFLPHAAAALCSGLLVIRRKGVCVGIYILLLLLFALFPVVGPIWLWPFMIWLHLLGLVVVASPLQSKAIDAMKKGSDPWRLVLGLTATSLTATLSGHLAGSILFEAVYWNPESEFWRATWQGLTFVYPFERGLITVLATIVGAPLVRALEKYGFRTRIK